MTVDEQLRSEIASRLAADAARHRCITADCKSSRHRCACGFEWEDNREAEVGRWRDRLGLPDPIPKSPLGAAHFGAVIEEQQFELRVLHAIATLRNDEQGCLHWTNSEWFADCAFCVAYDRMNQEV